MPDVFVAPEEKSIRSRMPILNQSASFQASQRVNSQNSFSITEPPLKTTQTADSNNTSASTIEPPVNKQTEQQTPSDTNQEPHDPIPSYDDIERRNGAFPLVTSFWQNPHSVYFDTQEPDERILLFLRRHFVTNVPWIVFTVLLLIIPPIIIYLLHIVHYPLTFLPFPLMQIIVILYYLLALTNAFVNFLDWYYNITIISTKRVLDIQLKDLVTKKVSATKIDLIQDVDFKQIGTIPSLFNYGDVIMQTAGKEVNFVADAVPNPELVVQIVEGLIGKEEIQGGQNATA